MLSFYFSLSSLVFVTLIATVGSAQGESSPPTPTPTPTDASIVDAELAGYRKEQGAAVEQLKAFVAAERSKYEAAFKKTLPEQEFNRQVDAMTKITELLTHPNSDWELDERDKEAALRLMDKLPAGAHQRFLSELEVLKHYSGPVGRRAVSLLLAARKSEAQLAAIPTRGAKRKPVPDLSPWQKEIDATESFARGLEACPVPDLATTWWKALEARQKEIENKLAQWQEDWQANEQKFDQRRKELTQIKDHRAELIRANESKYEPFRARYEQESAEYVKLATETMNLLNDIVSATPHGYAFRSFEEGMLMDLFPFIRRNYVDHSYRGWTVEKNIRDFAAEDLFLYRPGDYAKAIQPKVQMDVHRSFKEFGANKQYFKEPLERDPADREKKYSLTDEGISALRDLFPGLKESTYRNPEFSSFPTHLKPHRLEELDVALSKSQEVSLKLADTLSEMNRVYIENRVNKDELDKTKENIEAMTRNLQHEDLTQSLKTKRLQLESDLRKIEEEKKALTVCLKAAQASIRTVRGALKAKKPHTAISEAAKQHEQSRSRLRERPSTP